ncbi:MAG: response regulator, partial [Candidatus Paceibacterota bacterium]
GSINDLYSRNNLLSSSSNFDKTPSPESLTDSYNKSQDSMDTVISEDFESDDLRESPEYIQLEFRVSDTGIGILPEDLPRLFRVFGQLDQSSTKKYQGTGLGLVICQKLVELMSGEIEIVSSGPGHGSTAVFNIIAEKCDNIAPEYDHVQLLEMLEGLKVLVVDDSEANRLYMFDLLEKWKMIPVLCSSGKEALSYIRSGNRYDLGLIDMGMPNMNGAQLAQEINRLACSQVLTRQGNHIEKFPLLVLSSLNELEESDRTAFEGFLIKPVKAESLLRKIGTLFKPTRETDEIASIQCDGCTKSPKKSGKPKVQKDKDIDLDKNPSNNKDRNPNFDLRSDQIGNFSSDEKNPENHKDNDRLNWQESHRDCTVSEVKERVTNHDFPILLAEDIEMNQIVIKEMLSKLGYQNITIVSNGREALSTIEKHPNFFKLLILDIKMPYISGLEVAQQVHKIYPRNSPNRPKMVAMTALAMTGDREYYIQKGHLTDYITKPIDFIALKQMMMTLSG